jgi:hypothetical protein
MVAYNYKDPQKRATPFTRKTPRKSLLTFRGITKKVRKFRKNNIPKQIVINTSSGKPTKAKAKAKAAPSAPRVSRVSRAMTNGTTRRMTEVERLQKNADKLVKTVKARTRGQQKIAEQREREELQGQIAASQHAAQQAAAQQAAAQQAAAQLAAAQLAAAQQAAAQQAAAQEAAAEQAAAQLATLQLAASRQAAPQPHANNNVNALTGSIAGLTFRR